MWTDRLFGNRRRNRLERSAQPQTAGAARAATPASSGSLNIERWGVGVFLLVLASMSAHFSHLLLMAPGKGRDEVRQIQAAVDEQKQINRRLQHRNTSLKAEIDALKQGLNAIEEHARFKLGMIREDETFFSILKSPVKDEKVK